MSFPINSKLISESSRRNGFVDLLRGVAILLVLIRHFQIAYHLDDGFFSTFIPQFLLHPIVVNGNYGVTLFFVISGFLITSTSLRRFGSLGHIELPAFYSFRFARIAPNVTLMVGMVVVFSVLGIQIFSNNAGKVSLWISVLSIATFTHNLLMAKYGYFNYCLNVLWSLSVEEMFYLTFPILCLLLHKEVLIIFALGLFVVAGPVFRFFHRTDEIVALYGYLSCFDAIAIGCLVAILKPKVKLSPRMLHFLLLISASLWVFVYCYGGIMKNVVYGVSLIALSSGGMLLATDQTGNQSRALKNGFSRVIQWLGRKSYELYLFHVIVLAFIKLAVKRDDVGYYAKPVLLLSFLALSCLAAGLISFYYSEPLNLRFRKSVGLIKARRGKGKWSFSFR